MTHRFVDILQALRMLHAADVCWHPSLLLVRTRPLEVMIPRPVRNMNLAVEGRQRIATLGYSCNLWHGGELGGELIVREENRDCA